MPAANLWPRKLAPAWRELFSTWQISNLMLRLDNKVSASSVEKPRH